MITSMLNMVNSVFQAPQAEPSRVLPKKLMDNPFASPFITVQNRKNAFYGKNEPIQGGYFAGYYNGKKNIVGKKLFISV